jgi:hypothetical protein
LWEPWLPMFLRIHMLPQLPALRCTLMLRECAKRFQPANFIKLLHCTQEHLTAARKTASHAVSISTQEFRCLYISSKTLQMTGYVVINVISRCVHVTIIAVGKQYVLHILSVCLQL